MRPVSRRRTLLQFGLVTLVFGTSFPAIEVGLESLPPLSFATARYVLSATVLLAYVGLAGLPVVPRERRDLLAIGAGGVFLIGGTGLTFLGQQYTTGGVAAIIVSLSPVLTVLLGWTLLPTERIDRRGLLGVLVGFLGVAIVVNPTGASLLESAAYGRLLVLLAAISVSLGSVLVRRAHPTVPTPTLVGWSMAIGALVLAVGTVARGETLTASQVTPTALAAVGYLGVVAGALAFLLYFELIETVGALGANLVTYLNPVVALAVGWVLLGERIQPLAIIGFLVIAAGFALLTQRTLAAELARFRGAHR